MLKKAEIIPMKEIIAIMALCLMLILVMTGCGAKTAGSGGPVAGGAVTDMPACAGSEVPVEDNQSNFSKGFG